MSAINRVSNYQIYNINSYDIGKMHQELNGQIPYISSGKRIMSAKDDPSSNQTVKALDEELIQQNKYLRNINYIKNRNETIESNFIQIENNLLRFQQLMVQANNGSYGENEYSAITIELESLKDELLSFSNIQDENGNYIFAGYQTDKTAFVTEADGSISYQGDLGQRELQSNDNIFIATNRSGQQVFNSSANFLGDFDVDYIQNSSSFMVSSAKIVDPGAYDDVTNPPPYTFSFSDNLPGTRLDVTDSLGNNIYQDLNYVKGDDIEFNGVKIEISGEPRSGDSFEIHPSQSTSIFKTYEDAIAWTKQGPTGSMTPLDASKWLTQGQHLLEQMQSHIGHISLERAEIGNRLNQASRQESLIMDYSLELQTSKAVLEDLDYAAAVTKYEQATVNLDIAQQLFVSVRQLSLFNHI